jgi:hypothetical protein
MLDNKEIKLEKIVEIVNAIMGVDITWRSRDRRRVRGRWIYFWMAREHTSCTLSTIGLHLDLDHATVLHGLNNIQQDLDLKQFEYPTEFSEISLRMIMENEDINKRIIKVSDTLAGIRTEFYAEIEATVSKFEEAFRRMIENENSKMVEIPLELTKKEDNG